MKESFVIEIFSFQLTFVDEVNNGSVSNGGRQLVPGLLYIDDKAPKYKVGVILMIENVLHEYNMNDGGNVNM